MATKRKKKSGKWIQSATEKIKAKGTEGAFGKATPKKIAAAKKEGGLEEKRAVFASNMKKIAERKKHRGTTIKERGTTDNSHRSSMRKSTRRKRAYKR